MPDVAPRPLVDWERRFLTDCLFAGVGGTVSLPGGGEERVDVRYFLTAAKLMTRRVRLTLLDGRELEGVPVAVCEVGRDEYGDELPLWAARAGAVVGYELSGGEIVRLGEVDRVELAGAAADLAGPAAAIRLARWLRVRPHPVYYASIDYEADPPKLCRQLDGRPWAIRIARTLKVTAPEARR